MSYYVILAHIGSPVHCMFAPAIPLADIESGGGGGKSLSTIIPASTDLQLMYLFLILESENLREEGMKDCRRIGFNKKFRTYYGPIF